MSPTGCASEPELAAPCVFVPQDTHDKAAPPESATLFDLTFLHRIELVVADEHLLTLEQGSGPLEKDPRVPVKITYDGVTLDGAGIRLKGMSTYVGLSDRASFSIKMNEFDSGVRLAGMKKIVLNSTLHDSTLVRTSLSFSLARAAGLPAPRIAYAMVTFNGEPYGLYNVIEPINKQYLAQFWDSDTFNFGFVK